MELESDSLPLGYTYLVVPANHDNEIVVRIKEVKDQSSAEFWLKKFEEHTKTTWRKAATYPNCGKINIYRVDLRCVHLTDKRFKGLKSSKNTDCPAKINIVVKRYVAKSRANIIDDLVSEWPAIITFKAAHNHCIISAAVLKHRDMSDETRTKLQSLFHQGHNPSTALHCLKTDYLLENPEKYFEIAGDASYVPTYSVVHKLFKKEFSNEYGCCEDEEILKVPSEEPLIQQMGEINKTLSDLEKLELENLFNRINKGVQDQPNIFVPAVQKMLRNTSKFAQTETGLITALHTFGKYSGLPLKYTKGKTVQNKQVRRKHSTIIGIQPTAIGRRKKCLAGKNKLSAG